MANIILRQHLSNSTVPLNIALNGVVPTDTTDSTTMDVYWRWEDEPEMEFEFLASGVAGTDLVVPFDLKGRAIVLSGISKTATGVRSVRDVKEGEQVTVTPPLSRDAGFVDIVTGDYLNAGDLAFIYDDGGTAKARPAHASSSPPRPADGWASETVSPGDSIRIYLTATLISGLSGLTVGAEYYLDAGGGITTTAPSTSGYIRQRVGKAISDTVLSFERGEPITIA
jgi:hypothetical protein